MSARKVVLASKSPRRQELLRSLVDDFEIVVSDTDETLPEGISPDEAVRLLAESKARAVLELRPDALVIGADTLVVIDGGILGKPIDEQDAARMLRLLAGHAHEVYTGVCMCDAKDTRVFCCVTSVRFAPMSEEEIAWYVATGDPLDKAGAYGIQGIGARFITEIWGDYFNVMGLPLRMVYENFGDFTR